MYPGAFHMSPDMSWQVLRVQLWEAGHTFEEIDGLSLKDLGYILAYKAEKSRIEAAMADRNKRLSRGSGG